MVYTYLLQKAQIITPKNIQGNIKLIEYLITDYLNGKLVFMRPENTFN